MIRFRDVEGAHAVSSHNKLLESNGRVFWGLWLKQFENERDITRRLAELGASLEQIYIADTSQKANPTIYVATVSRVIIDSDNCAINPERVPNYYRNRIADVPIWFELSSKLIRLDVDDKLFAVLGVPTIYFLDYEKGKVSNIEPQREFDKARNDSAQYILHLTDIHLGEDHGFRQPGPARLRTDTTNHLTLAEALRKDLIGIGAAGKVAAIVISGDVVTRGGWERTYRFGNSEILGSQAAQLFLENLSEALDVPPEWFFMVPGNHDIVRQKPTEAAATEFLLNYKHENGFRVLREEFCGIYKLAPLNYVVKLEIGKRKLLLGLLNSAYLNDQVGFNDYGFVGDDAESVFQIMAGATDFSKILVLHHHVLPVYEREVLAKDNAISLTLDAANIMRRAQEVGVEFVLHGHQHFAKMMNFASWSSEMDKHLRPMDRKIRVVAGGSAGVKAERLPGGESNTYGLLDLSQADGDFRLRRIYSAGRLGDDW